MKIALLCLGGTLLLLLLLYWCMSHLHFRIGSRHLKVLCFRLVIRRVSLLDIAHASKREPKGAAERWYSTFRTSHRLLTIERKSGLRRNFVITPQNRYVFLADLKNAVRRMDPSAEWAALKTFEETSMRNAPDESRAASTEATAQPGAPRGPA